MSMKINKLEIENVKRIRAVKLEPTANGLTIIGGKNNQGRPLSWIPLPGLWEGKPSGRRRRPGKGP